MYRPDKAVDQKPLPFPGFISIVALGILLGVVTAGVRFFLPIGSTWLFNFQIPVAPQYLARFIIGIYTVQNNWFEMIRACVTRHEL